MTPIHPLTSSGSVGSRSRYHRKTSSASAMSYKHRSADDHAVLPDRMAAERERGDYTEVAAAPRSAQTKSGCDSGLAVTKRPSASTTSAETRLSSVRPKRRVR